GAQLRHPLASLKPFSYSTSKDFAAQFDPEVNLCGQCHNMRGATWQDTSRYPHYSPQYNMVIGSGGVETGVAPQSKHRENAKQCVSCHMHSTAVANPTEANPNVMGHSFKVKIEACASCHKEGDGLARMTTLQNEIETKLNAVKALLDQWGNTKAAEALRTKYGALAWEYNTVGHLSNPLEQPGIAGPTTAEQAAVPDSIKQARFNLYLIYQDHSFGVHNAEYARYLLKVAEDKVKAELGL
ncbi:MAG: ammonia-forming cytochrome c nitrite reductase subunit c552, partial [Verrucomicrobiota bacterium]